MCGGEEDEREYVESEMSECVPEFELCVCVKGKGREAGPGCVPLVRSGEAFDPSTDTGLLDDLSY